MGVIREAPGTLVRVDRDNNPVTSVEVHKRGQEGFMIVDGCFAGGPTLVFSGTHAHQAEEGIQIRENCLSIFSMEGEELARLAEHVHRRDYANFVLAESQVLPPFFRANCVGSDGRVHTAPDRNQYAIEIYSPTGELQRVVSLEYGHYQRSQAEWQRLYDAFEAVIRGADIEIRIDIEKNEFDILPMQHGVRVGEDNSLWIHPSRGVHDQPPGAMLTFDVFDPAGRFVQQISFACDADGIWDGFFFVGPDRVVVVTGHVEALLAQYGGGANTYEDEEGESAMEVICHRIPG